MIRLSAKKAPIARRQPPAAMIACPSGAAKNVPMEPAAETMPKPRLRRSGRRTRAATLEAMPLVVHESAMPISPPLPSLIIAPLLAPAGIARPAA